MREIPALILDQARRTPDATAVRQWDRVLTYGELTEQALRVAWRLRRLGVAPEVRVGLCTDRLPASIVAVLGILVAGGAYVPLDLANPRRRNLDILADSAATVVVTDDTGRRHLTGGTSRATAHTLALEDSEVVLLDLEEAAHTPAPAPTPPVTGLRPHNIAHVLYTSGSTGRPKGVLTTHANLAAFVTSCGSWTGGVGPTMRSLGISSLGFDAATYDVFVPLVAGGSIQLVGTADRADPARLQRFIAEHRVTWGFVTPAVLALLDPAKLPEFSVVVVGGDVVPPDLVEPWTADGRRRFFDAYGPTEATVSQLATRLSGRWTTDLPIGRPLPGQRAYVLDEHGEPVGPGGEGELCLAGTGTARGYLGAPGLTASRFVPDPFAPEPGARMYRTGDVVRVLADGRLGYVGRRDGQLKISGQRVELAEIEAVLREHPDVDEAAVVAVDGPAGPELTAFVGPATAPEPEVLRTHAARRLTEVMLPRRIERLDRLPLAPTGKVDRGHLRTLAARPTTASPRPAATTVLDTVARLWHRALGGPPPDADDDFFASGGHSLAAMRLVAAIRAELGREIGVEDVFASRALRDLARRVVDAPVARGPALEPGRPPTLAPSQRRLWFLDQLAPGGTAYNVAFAERLRGPLDVDGLRAALSTVAARQDVLRWRIPQRDGEPFAVCDPPDARPVELAVVDLGPEALSVPPHEPESALRDALGSAAARPFDLEHGPLWRAALFRLGPGDHVLLLVFHHAIVDGWSQAPLYAELSAAYGGGNPRTPPAFGYADYAHWRARRDDRSGELDLAWWRDHLAGAPTVLDLPRDRPRPPVQTYAGDRVTRAIDAAVASRMERFAADVGAPPALVVLAALGHALHRLTGHDDLVLGGITADRSAVHRDLERVVGFFVDIVPLRLRIEESASFEESVRACLREFVDATSHPAAPLERIVDVLRVPRDPTRSALVQVAYNVYNFDEPTLTLPGIATSPVPVPVPGSPFDLTVYLARRQGSYVLDQVYNPELYDRARIERSSADLLALLDALVLDPTRPIREIEVGFLTAGVTQTPAHAVEPRPAARRSGSTAPNTPTERLVEGIWRSVLDSGPFGVDDNFFDAGGNSLALVAVRAALEEQVGRPVPVVELFRYPSIRTLAAHLDTTAPSTTSALSTTTPTTTPTTARATPSTEPTTEPTSRPELSRASRIAAARRQRSRRRRP